MTNPAMAAWWTGLDEDERRAILIDWPRAHGLSLDALALVPPKHRGGKAHPERWAWQFLDPTTGQPTSKIDCSQEFADFLHERVEEPFHRSNDS